MLDAGLEVVADVLLGVVGVGLGLLLNIVIDIAVRRLRRER